MKLYRWKNADKRRIQAYLDKWRTLLKLVQWKVDLEFCKKDIENSQADNVIADISSNYKYLYATINIYPPYIKETVAMQEQAIIHELCHLLLEGILQHIGKLRNHIMVSQYDTQVSEEQIVEQLSRVCYELLYTR